MRLVKTRGLLSVLIMKYRKSEKGSTITDGDFERTYKELRVFERWYSIYKVITIILTILICCCLLCGLFNCNITKVYK